MKLLMVSGSLPRVVCGIGDYTAVLAAGLARVPAMSVDILTTDDALIDPALVTPATVWRWPAGWQLAALANMVTAIRRRRPDLVHIHYPAVGYGRALGIVLAPLALRLFGRLPVVLTIHERRERSRPARLTIDLMAMSANRVIVLDSIEAGDLGRHVPGVGSKIVLGEMISTVPVRRGIVRSEVRAELSAGLGELVISTFGLLHPRRRVEQIIDALAVLNRRGVPTRLLIMGGEAQYDPEVSRRYAEELRRQVAERGLAPLINWLGHVDAGRLSAYLQGSDVCVLLYPSGASGRNTTLRAAIEHGVPVITTEGSSTPTELRKNSRLTFIRPDAPPEQLADAILDARRNARAAGGSGSPSNLQAHIDLHLQVYRELNASRDLD